MVDVVIVVVVVVAALDLEEIHEGFVLTYLNSVLRRGDGFDSKRNQTTTSSAEDAAEF